MPIKEHQPSAHEVFIGYWKPTKDDTLGKRVSGFGATMNQWRSQEFRLGGARLKDKIGSKKLI